MSLEGRVRYRIMAVFIAFYESPLGNKVVESLPAVAQESIALGSQWASTRMPEVMQDIQTRRLAEGVIT
jgi:hypothetical protein